MERSEIARMRFKRKNLHNTGNTNRIYQIKVIDKNLSIKYLPFRMKEENMKIENTIKVMK